MRTFSKKLCLTNAKSVIRLQCMMTFDNMIENADRLLLNIQSVLYNMQKYSM